MSEYDHRPRIVDMALTRRELLARMGNGMAALGLVSLMGTGGLLAQTAPKGKQASLNPLSPKQPHFTPKAKRVVFFFANGGPSHVDTFDPKPMLDKHHGQPLPYANLPTERRTGTCFRSPYKFQKYGQSGLEISDLFPNLAQHADNLCVIRSMHADVPNHEPSLLLMNCGDARLIRPSFGSWVVYGLGTENQNLPGFIVMCPRGYPIQDTQNWQNAFLPGIFQGTYIDPSKTNLEQLIQHIKNNYVNLEEQRAQLDLLAKLNERHKQQRQQEAQLEARIQSFELAYRMQIDATDAFDIEKEPQHVRDAYGKGVFARQTLMARRLLERGVRFIQLYHGAGQPWDNHDDLEVAHRQLARECDQPIAAFIKDLKERGMLDDTLVIWGGEFGRTPTVELPTPGANAGKQNGRDHNHHGFSMWLCGGGVKGGYVHGATDEFGFRAEQDKVHVHDLHATILHLLGFDHTKLTYRYAGRDFRLTDVYGNVVREVLA
jgi:DNA-binding transcriptional MerR regulator